MIQTEKVPELSFRDTFGNINAVITFEIDGIHSFYENLKSSDVPVGEMTFKEEGGYNFTVKDPDGHVSHIWGGWPE